MFVTHNCIKVITVFKRGCQLQTTITVSRYVKHAQIAVNLPTPLLKASLSGDAKLSQITNCLFQAHGNDKTWYPSNSKYNTR